MTALAQELQVSQAKWTRKQLPLGPALKAIKGGSACGDSSAHVVKPGASANANLVPLGVFAETIDNTANTATTALVNVDFLYERTVLYRANDGGITASDLFSLAYYQDDQTVTKTSSGRSALGRIVDVDTGQGLVGVMLNVP